MLTAPSNRVTHPYDVGIADCSFARGPHAGCLIVEWEPEIAEAKLQLAGNWFETRAGGVAISSGPAPGSAQLNLHGGEVSGGGGEFLRLKGGGSTSVHGTIVRCDTLVSVAASARTEVRVVGVEFNGKLFADIGSLESELLFETAEVSVPISSAGVRVVDSTRVSTFSAYSSSSTSSRPTASTRKRDRLWCSEKSCCSSPLTTISLPRPLRRG